jgi:hypothetical protein
MGELQLLKLQLVRRLKGSSARSFDRAALYALMSPVKLCSAFVLLYPRLGVFASDLGSLGLAWPDPLLSPHCSCRLRLSRDC